MSSVEIKSVDAVRVRRAADEYAARLFASNSAAEEIIVFGSFADDRYAPGSDLDVFIVLAASSEPVRDRVSSFLPVGFPVPMDVFPFTRTEMAKLEPSPLLNAVRKSRWRYYRPPSDR